MTCILLGIHALAMNFPPQSRERVVLCSRIKESKIFVVGGYKKFHRDINLGVVRSNALGPACDEELRTICSLTSSLLFLLAFLCPSFSAFAAREECTESSEKHSTAEDHSRGLSFRVVVKQSGSAAIDIGFDLAFSVVLFHPPRSEDPIGELSGVKFFNCLLFLFGCALNQFLFFL